MGRKSPFVLLLALILTVSCIDRHAFPVGKDTQVTTDITETRTGDGSEMADGITDILLDVREPEDTSMELELQDSEEQKDGQVNSDIKTDIAEIEPEDVPDTVEPQTCTEAGQSCDDDDKCTWPDYCQLQEDKYVCIGVPVQCADDNPCTDDSCNPDDGECQFESSTMPCHDANPCTVGDQCQGGSCQAGAESLDCDDDNPCTNDDCDPQTVEGCAHGYNTKNCNDGEDNTIGDHCVDGVCVPGDWVANPCSGDENCELLQNDNLCDGQFSCQDGNCMFNEATIVTCSQEEPPVCQVAVCDPADGVCKDQWLPNSTPCDDGDACTYGETCQDGSCGQGLSLNCNDKNSCTDDSCHSESGCLNTDNELPCDDGNACTEGDVCAAGTCEPGEAVNPDDDNPCTTDWCDGATGVHNQSKDDGIPCQLDGICVGLCQDGTCTESAVEECNGSDDTCEGDIDEGFTDSDDDGEKDCMDGDDDGDGIEDDDDCAPLDNTIFPGQAEDCQNQQDDDCDELVDGDDADCLATNQGLALYLPFDILAKGEFADATGHGRNATVINGASTAPGITSGAADLDGDNDFLVLPDPNSLAHGQQRTVSLWFQNNHSVRKRVLFSQEDQRDLDDDGWPDIVIANRWDGENFDIGSTIHWGHEQGFGILPVGTLTGIGSAAVAAADLDENGFLDLVVANYGTSTSTGDDSLIHWQGPEGFVQVPRPLTSYGPQSVAIVNIFGDLYPEVIFPGNFYDGSYTESTVIYSGMEGGPEKGKGFSVLSYAAGGVAAGDLNRDDINDLIVTNYHSKDIQYTVNSSVFLGPVDAQLNAGTFGLPTSGGVAVSIADLNGDGWPDLVFSNNGTKSSSETDSVVYWNTGDTQAMYDVANKTLLPTKGAMDNQVTDLNGDGYPDIVFGCAREGPYPASTETDSLVYWGSQVGPTPDNVTGLPTIGAKAIGVGDLNLDGNLELIFASDRNDGGDYNVGSRLFWGSKDGFDVDNFEIIPSTGAYGVSIPGSPIDEGSCGYGTQPSDYGRFEVYTKDGEIVFSLHDFHGRHHRLSVSYDAGEWTHIAAGYDAAAGKLRLYKNGQMADVELVEFDMGSTTPWRMRIGSDCEHRDKFAGRIDELRVYDEFLDEETVQTLHDFPAGAPVCNGAPGDCDDGNSCTDDICDTKLGCTNLPNDNPCDDADPCTIGDQCSASTCQAGAVQLSCADGNPCTNESCVPETGCQYLLADDGTTCGPLPGWQCLAGECICEPACNNKDCGGDGCGGTCGTCGDNFACNDAGKCLWAGLFCGGVECPELPDYSAKCNLKDHCEYTNADNAGWKQWDVWIYVPPGTFAMGSPEDEIGHESGENTMHMVYFDYGFFVAKYEGVVAAYHECEEKGDCPLPAVDDFDGSGCGVNQINDKANHPQNGLDWYAAKDFCAWFAPGGRLPSEAEWEYAATGPVHTVRVWGDTPEPTCDNQTAVFKGDVEGFGCGTDGTWPVGSMVAGLSWAGATDMAGNVWEWTEDCFHNNYNGAPAFGEPWTASCSSEYRVSRGGGFSTVPSSLRTSERTQDAPTKKYSTQGTRCVRPAPATHCGGVKCPYLPDYFVTCNRQDYCEYYNQDTTGHKRWDVWIFMPPGSFDMGTPEGEAPEQFTAQPVHKVTFDDGFLVSKYELTVEEYEACVDAGMCKTAEVPEPDPTEWETSTGAKGREHHPQNGIDWNDAKNACQYLASSGRLLTEAEWEYAATGPLHRKYPWGNNPIPGCSNDTAVFNSEGNDPAKSGCGTGGTLLVGSKLTGASRSGALDMIGNVREIVHDCYHDGYVDAPTDGSAWLGMDENCSRMDRGGDFITADYHIDNYLQTGSRHALGQDHRDANTGTRCARPAPPPDCVPDCEDKSCGDDGCGGSCGMCPKGSSCTNGKCPGIEHVWSFGWGAAEVTDYPLTVEVDPSGNVFVAGTFGGTVDFGGQCGTEDAGPHNAAFLAKLSPDGACQWVSVFQGSINMVRVKSIIPDPQANWVYLAGDFHSAGNKLTIGGVTITGNGNWDLFLAKVDGNGNGVWVKGYGGPEIESSGNSSLGIAANGDLLWAGKFDSASIDFGGPCNNLSNAGGNNPEEGDMFVARLDSMGNCIWAKPYGGIGNEAAHSLTILPDQTAIVTGQTTSALLDLGGDVIHPNVGGEDIVVLALDQNGSHLWSRTFGGTLDERGDVVVLTSDGSDVHIAGRFNSPILEFDELSVSNYAGSAPEALDIFIVRLDAGTGQAEAATSFGGTGSDKPYSLRVDDAGLLYLSGTYTSSVINFGGGYLTHQGGGPAGKEHVFVLALAADYSHRWSSVFGGNYQDQAYTTVSGTGELILTGSFNEPEIDFGGGPVVNAGGISGGYMSADIFIAKFQQVEQ
jgi:formylglycine-generating enzyme required for sulfatase activity